MEISSRLLLQGPSQNHYRAALVDVGDDWDQQLAPHAVFNSTGVESKFCRSFELQGDQGHLEAPGPTTKRTNPRKGENEFPWLVQTTAIWMVFLLNIPGPALVAPVSLSEVLEIEFFLDSFVLNLKVSWFPSTSWNNFFSSLVSSSWETWPSAQAHLASAFCVSSSWLLDAFPCTLDLSHSSLLLYSKELLYNLKLLAIVI